MFTPRRVVLSGCAAAFLACVIACGGGGTTTAPPTNRDAAQGAPPNAAGPQASSRPAPKSKWNMGEEATKEGQKAVRDKLTELDSFKDEAKFHEFGFGRGGPYHAWLASLQTLRESDEAALFSSPERIALGYLLNMGTDYIKSKGQETKFTRYARKEIEDVLSK